MCTYLILLYVYGGQAASNNSETWSFEHLASECLRYVAKTFFAAKRRQKHKQLKFFKLREIHTNKYTYKEAIKMFVFAFWPYFQPFFIFVNFFSLRSI